MFFVNLLQNDLALVRFDFTAQDGHVRLCHTMLLHFAGVTEN